MHADRSLKKAAIFTAKKGTHDYSQCVVLWQGFKRTGHRWRFTFGLGMVLCDLIPAAGWRFGDVVRDRLCSARALLLPLSWGTTGGLCSTMVGVFSTRAR